MMSTARDILCEALRQGLLTPTQAEQLQQLKLDDDALLEKVFEIDAQEYPEILRLEGILFALHEDVSTCKKDAESDGSVNNQTVNTVDGLPERFHIVRLVGQGGMGRVFEAVDQTLGRRVALKLPQDKPAYPDLDIRFQREQSLLAELKDPNLIPIFDAGILHDGRPYFVMPFIDGSDLLTYLTTQAPMLHDIVRLFESIARAVGTAHMIRLVHRDLKPGNILVTADGVPQIVDFGIAKYVEEPDDTYGAKSFPALSGRTGTPGFMSPEQSSGKSVSPASDVYSLGILLRGVLFGVWPSESDLSDATNGTHSPIDLPSVPNDLREIVRKCLEVDSSHRYQTGSELADDLHDFLVGLPVRAVERGRRTYVIKKHLRRHRAIALTVAASVLSIVVTLIAAFNSINNQRILAENASERAQVAAANERQARQVAQDNAQQAVRQRERAEAELLLAGVTRALDAVGDRRFENVKTSLERVPLSQWGWECDRLMSLGQLGPRAMKILGNHDWGVVALLVSPSGSEIVSAGHDGRIVVWNRNGQAVTELATGNWDDKRRLWSHVSLSIPGEDKPNVTEPSWTGLAWIEAGKSFVATTLDGRIVYFDMHGNARVLYSTDKDRFFCVATHASADRILAGTESGTLIVLATDLLVEKAISVGNSPILDIDWVADNKVIVGTEEGAICLVDMDTGTRLSSIQTAGPTWDLEVSSDSRRVAVAAATASIDLYKISGSACELQFERRLPLPSDQRQARYAYRVHWLSESGRIVAGDELGRLILWNESGALEWNAPDQEERMLHGRFLGNLALPLQRRVASLDMTPDHFLITAGHDTSIKKWSLNQDDGIFNLTVGGKPQIAFVDETREDMWVLNENGRLGVWDLSTKQLLASTTADPQGSRACVGSQTGIVATAANDGISLWRRSSNGIERIGFLPTPSTSIVSLALSPTADRVAARTANEVLLWKVATTKLIARNRLSSITSATPGADLAFNSDGDRLAMIDSERSCVILDGTSLALLERVPLFSGANGTAIAWHPARPELLCGGNARGRIQLHPETMMLQNVTGHLRDQPVADLAFSPDGKRVALCSASGIVVIVEPYTLGPIYTLTSKHADTSNPTLTSLAFSRNGSDLLMVHGDGHIEVLSGTLRRSLPNLPRENWSTDELLAGADVHDIMFRQPSIAINNQNELGILYLRNTIATGPDDIGDRNLCFRCKQHNEWSERVVEHFTAMSPRERDACFRSIALKQLGGTWWGIFRSSLPNTQGGLGRLVMLGLPLDVGPPTTWTREDVTELGNHGFDVTLFGDATAPAALHFSHGHQGLMLTRQQAHRWQTKRVGRRGDGFRLKAAAGPDRRMHIFFEPTRFNGDPLPGTLLSSSPADEVPEVRKVIDPSSNAFPIALTLDHNHMPILLSSRSSSNRHPEIVVTTSKGEEYQELVAFPFDPKTEVVLSICHEQDGRIGIPVLNEHHAQLRYISGKEGDWRETLVFQLSKSEQGSTDNIGWLGPFVILDNSQAPIIVLGLRSRSGSWIRAFRRVHH